MCDEKCIMLHTDQCTISNFIITMSCILIYTPYNELCCASLTTTVYLQYLWWWLHRYTHSYVGHQHTGTRVHRTALNILQSWRVSMVMFTSFYSVCLLLTEYRCAWWSPQCHHCMKAGPESVGGATCLSGIAAGDSNSVGKVKLTIGECLLDSDTSDIVCDLC